MNDALRAFSLGALALTLTGCPAAPTEPPPPPRKAEVLPAPPNARGARAAGTDAAPKPELGIPLGDDEAPSAAPEGGAPTPVPPASPSDPAPSPTPATPDGGTAL